jgi:hypothetical protein
MGHGAQRMGKNHPCPMRKRCAPTAGGVPSALESTAALRWTCFQNGKLFMWIFPVACSWPRLTIAN